MSLPTGGDITDRLGLLMAVDRSTVNIYMWEIDLDGVYLHGVY